MLYRSTLGSLQFVYGNDCDNEHTKTAREAKLEHEFIEKFLYAMKNGTEFPATPNKKQYEIWDKAFPKRYPQDLSKTI